MADRDGSNGGSGVSYELGGEPMLVRRNGAYLLNVDVDIDASDIAAVYEAAADVIRRIQGRADDEKRGGVSYAFHYLAQMLSDSHPKASKYMTALADWLLTDDGDDFTPPADANAYGDQLRYMADSWIQTNNPVAGQKARDLADWYENRDGDFPADTDAIAAAEKRGERRGVEREREAAAYWLEKRPKTFEHTPQWYANRLRRGSHLAQYIKDGVHLNGGESDDA